MGFRRFLALLALASLACEPGEDAAAQSGPTGIFEVAGRGVSIQCWPGKGPTVLIDAGLGESSVGWTGVAEGFGGEVAVCAFDRPGYGGSDPGPFPRTPDANAASLKGLIASAGLEGPFVLVGHSLGGLNALAFWEEDQDEVAGLILLDPPPRAWLERERFDGLWGMAMAAGEQLQTAADQARDEASSEADQLETMASEHVGMLETGSSVAQVDSFGDLPLLVIAAERANPAFGDSAAAYQRFWVAESRKLAGRSSRGRVEVLESVGHNMNHEVPDLLVSLIREFLAGLYPQPRGPHEMVARARWSAASLQLLASTHLGRRPSRGSL